MDTTGSLQEKNGKYYAVINYNDDKGKRKQKWVSLDLSTQGNNRRRAERALKELLVSEEEVVYKNKSVSVADYFESWLPEIQKEVRPNTFRTYELNMLNHIIPYFREPKHNIMLNELKPVHLENYYKAKTQPHSRVDGSGILSNTTIKHHHQNISKALTDACRKGLISSNPASYAKTPKLKKFKSEFLNPSEISEMLVLFKGSAVELPVQLCAIYGFRRSEVLGLKWSCIDFENKTIMVVETLQQGVSGDYVDAPKTESSCRTLPLIDSVRTLLLQQKELQAQRRDLLGDFYIESDYVCTSCDGAVITPNYLTTQFHKTLMKSRLPLIRLHDLRHSVASNLLNEGFSIAQVQEWLGHGSAFTTLTYYASADKHSKISVANQLQAIIKL